MIELDLKSIAKADLSMFNILIDTIDTKSFDDKTTCALYLVIICRLMELVEQLTDSN